MSDEFKEKNGELVYMMRPSALPILFVIAKHLRTSFNIRQKTTAAFSFLKVSLCQFTADCVHQNSLTSSSVRLCLSAKFT